MESKIIRSIRQLRDFLILKKSPLFDERFYQSTYPEVSQSHQNPIVHYLRVGWREEKNPSQQFDTSYYLHEYPDVRQAGLNPLVHYIRKGLAEGRLPRQADRRIYPRYPLWVEQFDHLSRKDRHQIQERITRLPAHPPFTLLFFLADFSQKQFQQSLQSLAGQLYAYWEAFILYSPEQEPWLQDKSLQQLLKNEKIWSLRVEDDPAKNYQDALESCSGKMFGFMFPECILSPQALYHFAEELNTHPDTALLYCDEDVIDSNGQRTDPYFKPDWNPELLLHQDYISFFSVFNISLVKDLGMTDTPETSRLAWDTAMRIGEAAADEHILHLPFPLCHRLISPQPAESDPTPGAPSLEFSSIVTAHFKRMNIAAEVTPDPASAYRIRYPRPHPEPLVSIIIPTRDNHQLLSRCLESIDRRTSYENYEIYIVNNQSSQHETLELFTTLKARPHIELLDYPHPFNFSAINNFAAQSARGEVLLFLNDDVEVLTDGWLTELSSQALRPGIGAVGAMLYYPNDTIQHAGVVLGLNGIAGHIYQGEPRGYRGVRNRAVLPQNITALTAACLAVEKDKFLEVSGFNESDLPIAFNDIDLCIRLMKAGYRNLWTPHVELFHHESVSRGPDDTPEKQARFTAEMAYMRETHGPLLLRDPAYNPNLALVDYNFRLAFPPRIRKPWQTDE